MLVRRSLARPGLAIVDGEPTPAIVPRLYELLTIAGTGRIAKAPRNSNLNTPTQVLDIHGVYQSVPAGSPIVSHALIKDGEYSTDDVHAPALQHYPADTNYSPHADVRDWPIIALPVVATSTHRIAGQAAYSISGEAFHYSSVFAELTQTGPLICQLLLAPGTADTCRIVIRDTGAGQNNVESFRVGEPMVGGTNAAGTFTPIAVHAVAGGYRYLFSFEPAVAGATMQYRLGTGADDAADTLLVGPAHLGMTRGPWIATAGAPVSRDASAHQFAAGNLNTEAGTVLMHLRFSTDAGVAANLLTDDVNGHGITQTADGRLAITDGTNTAQTAVIDWEAGDEILLCARYDATAATLQLDYRPKDEPIWVTGTPIAFAGGFGAGATVWQFAHDHPEPIELLDLQFWPIAITDARRNGWRYIATNLNYYYLNDALSLATRFEIEDPAPRLGIVETLGLAAPAPRYTVYKEIGAVAGMASKLAQIQAIRAAVKGAFYISPRAYQGGFLAPGAETQPNFGITFSTTGPATENHEFYAGHWMYLQGTTLVDAINATQLTCRIPDGEQSRIDVGQDCVLYDGPAGSFANAEHVRVKSKTQDGAEWIIEFESDLDGFFDGRAYKSQRSAHGAGAILAQHCIGVGGGTHHNWAFNTSTACPLDSADRTFADALVVWCQANITLNNLGNESGVNYTAIYFDADQPVLSVSATRLDLRNDLTVQQKGITDAGVNLWAEGLELLYQAFAAAFPDHHILTGMKDSRGHGVCHGGQIEAAFSGGTDDGTGYGGFEPRICDYGHTGDGNGGFDDTFRAYIVGRNYYQGRPTGRMHCLSKAATALYPIHYSSNPPPDNSQFRLPFAATLLDDGLFAQQNSSEYPCPWYDEGAVDTTPGSPTYGHAIPVSDTDSSAAVAAGDWLGWGQGPYRRLYDLSIFAPANNLFANRDFAAGTTDWVVGNLTHSIDSVDAPKGVGQSLRIDGHVVYTRNAGEAYVRSPVVTLEAGKEYTVCFAAKADQMRTIVARMQSARFTYLITPDWTRIVHTFKATVSGTFRLELNMGVENIGLRVADFYCFEGNANVFRRDFDGGIVVVNATPSERTIELGSQFMRIKGTGQDPINDGSMVTSVTLPPYDAAILVRPDPLAVAA